MAEPDPSFLVLGVPAAQAVAAKLEASPASPLRERPPGAAAGAAADRSAAQRELAAKGVSLESPATAEAAPYREALDVLAQPEALVRVRILEPGLEPGDIAVVVRAQKAAAFAIRDQSLLVGPARDLDALAASLADQARHEGPLVGQQIVLWPAALKVLSLVWGRDQDASKEIARTEAEKRLAGEGRPAEKVKAALDELVAGGIVVAAGDALGIVAAYRPFLDRVWSGHGLQLEYLLFAGASSFEQVLAGNGPRLLFMGPPGDRVLNDPVTGEALRRFLNGARPAEDRAIRLAAVPAEGVVKLVRLLLGLEKPPVSAPS